MAPAMTDAQRERLAQLHGDIQKKLAPYRQQLEVKRGELKQLWSADAPSREAILKKLAEIDAIEVAMRPAMVDGRLAHLALLTPAQRTSMREPHRGGHGPGGHPPMGGAKHPGGMMNAMPEMDHQCKMMAAGDDCMVDGNCGADRCMMDSPATKAPKPPSP
jgi:hypothetical protein